MDIETLGWIMITLGIVIGGVILLLALAVMFSDDD